MKTLLGTQLSISSSWRVLASGINTSVFCLVWRFPEYELERKWLFDTWHITNNQKNSKNPMEALKNHKFLTWGEVDSSQNILLTKLYLFHFHSNPFVLHYAFRPNLSYCIVYTFYVNNFSCKYNLVTSSKSSEADSSQTRPVRALF